MKPMSNRWWVATKEEALRPAGTIFAGPGPIVLTQENVEAVRRAVECYLSTLSAGQMTAEEAQEHTEVSQAWTKVAEALVCYVRAKSR